MLTVRMYLISENHVQKRTTDEEGGRKLRGDEEGVWCQQREQREQNMGGELECLIAEEESEGLHERYRK